ncbi:SAM-dependent methyltransferase [Actinoplanes sp. N902-109]|uniref:SAM-dependent methyltransferase n=1 Tax=Actinoplanes sp. (strain N902-109) TaxID=649831 RepID=UPI0003293B75|nr:SAM-dependent methyltransferase [Actinoplanes sp. N902-109]AGL17130.1 methyltransferase [Actinoplanes sp. N902-109]
MPDSDVPDNDVTVPQSARIWNYWLGGTDNLPADRAAGDEYRALFPTIDQLARESRQYLTRAVRFLAGEAGIRQFLDVGAGLPAVDNTHQIARRAAPGARVVYVDKDPYVLEHGRTMLARSPQISAIYLAGDLQNPPGILAIATRELDLDEPVALILNGVLGHIPSTAEARAIVSRLMGGLPPGSYVSISDGTLSEVPGLTKAQDHYNNDTGAVPYILRTPEEFTSLFTGLDLVPPGIVECHRWRPDPDGGAAVGNQLGGIGRKP